MRTMVALATISMLNARSASPQDIVQISTSTRALLEGGSAEQCGWLRDKFGVAWQIVPTILGELMTDPDRQKARRVSDAMLTMVKLDIAGLKAAAG